MSPVVSLPRPWGEADGRYPAGTPRSLLAAAADLWHEACVRDRLPLTARVDPGLAGAVARTYEAACACAPEGVDPSRPRAVPGRYWGPTPDRAMDVLLAAARLATALLPEAGRQTLEARAESVFEALCAFVGDGSGYGSLPGWEGVSVGDGR